MNKRGRTRSATGQPRRKGRDPEKARHYPFRKYGITADDFERILVRQGNRCAICGAASLATKRGWHVDHAHADGTARGVLCSQCNVGLGMFKDDPLRLELAAAYLRRFS